MSRRVEPQQAVPVTVRGAPPRPPRGRRQGSRRPVVLVLVLLLVILAGLAVRNTRQSAHEAEARSAHTVSWTVVRATVDPGNRGVPAALLQSGIVDVVLRNDSQATLHLLGARLDGAGPVSSLLPTTVRAGATALLPVTWRVRCAEVGVTPGPRLLELRVRLGSRRSYATRLPLTGEGTYRAFHAAAVSACDVLVRTPEGLVFERHQQLANSGAESPASAHQSPTSSSNPRAGRA